MIEVPMIAIPAGTAVIGSDDPGACHTPRHTVPMAAFELDRHPVTCAAYAAFLQATNHPAPPDWPDGQCPSGRQLHPVVNVSCADAEAYAAWAGKRLPTEYEWEYAARGPQGLRYPWGDEHDPQCCALNNDHLPPVEAFPTGASPFEVLDLIGGVWEWTADWYTTYPGAPANIHCGQKYRVLRGGAYAWFYSWPHLRGAFERARLVPYGRNAITGFRCARTTEETL